MKTLSFAALLFGLWVVLSGQFDAFHLGLGAFSVLCVVLLNRGKLCTLKCTRGRGPFQQFAHEALCLLRFPLYALWLMKEIFIANLQICTLALSPKRTCPTQPQFVQLHTKLHSPAAQVLYAQSITLTPGTVTAEMNGHNLLVHAINQASADGLGGKMERRVAWVFNQKI